MFRWDVNTWTGGNELTNQLDYRLVSSRHVAQGRDLRVDGPGSQHIHNAAPITTLMSQR
jgi:hypothetical protein